MSIMAEPVVADDPASSSRAARTLVTVATYNELENLPRLVAEIFRYVPQADLLVIDDNSPDGTGRWCDEEAERDERVHVLHRAGKLGLGTATIAGMQYAIDQEYDYVVNLDADFSHPPRDIPALLALLEGPDAVDVGIGSRYVPGGAIEGWPWHRHFMSQGVNLYARAFLGLACRDCSGAFRSYRVSTLRKLDLAGFWSVGYSFQEEVLWRLKQAGATFGETPITFVDRQLGSSKIHLGEAFSALWIIFRLGLKNWLGL